MIVMNIVNVRKIWWN